MKTLDGISDNFKPITYHPSLRVYIFSLPWFIGSLGMYLFAKQLWVLILTAIGVTRLPSWIDWSVLIEVTEWIGLLWLAWLVTDVCLYYFGKALTIDEKGISYQQGIIMRDVTNIRFNEISRIGMRQGFLDRFLDTGILEFASSGTNDADIRFVGIASPVLVRDEIEEMIELRQARGRMET